MLLLLRASPAAGAPRRRPWRRHPQARPPQASRRPRPRARSASRATPSKRDVTVGRDLHARAEGERARRARRYTFPGEAGDDARRAAHAARRRRGRESRRAAGRPHRYEAAVFALGRGEIPPIPVRYRLPDGTTGEAATAPLDAEGRLAAAEGRRSRSSPTCARRCRCRIGRAFWVALAVGARARRGARGVAV